MRRLLHSPFLVIVILLGGFSTFLAYKGEYEAAMTGAGVAVAAATAGSVKDEDTEYPHKLEQDNILLREKEILLREKEIFLSEKLRLVQIIEQEQNTRQIDRDLFQLKQDLFQLKQDLALDQNQRFEQQAKMDLKIERLNTEKIELLPESKLEKIKEKFETEIFEEWKDSNE